MEYVKAGRFPETSTPTRPPHVSNFPEVEWSVKHSPSLPYYLEYEGSSGVTTPRYVMVVSEGSGNNGQEYMGRLTANGSRRFGETGFGIIIVSDASQRRD